MELTPEELKNNIQKAKDFWDIIKQAFMEIYKEVCKAFKEFISILSKVPGYKRLFKRIKYYESISIDKSNNWRKFRGLHLLRN